LELFKFKFSFHPQEFALIPLFDIHFGSKLHNSNLWKKVVNLISNNPHTYCYLGGDILEFINVDHKHFTFENLEKSFQRNVDRILTYSVEYAVEKLEPIKDKILFIHAGNHDTRYLYKQGFDPISSIAKLLNIPYFTNSFEVLCKFLFHHNNKTYSFNLYSHHGVGHGTKAGSLINRLEDIMSAFDADIYVMGHSHQLVFTYKNYITTNLAGTALITKRKYLLRVGGFRNGRALKITDYSEKAGFKPSTIGTFLIQIKHLNKQGRLDFHITPVLE
jgi:predicted phosphodiesterase